MKALAGVILILLVGADVGCALGKSGDWPLAATVSAASINPPSSNTELTVATYNLHEIHNPDSLRDDFARISADVWLLQEVRVPRDAMDRPAELLRSLLPDAQTWNIVIVPVSPIPGSRDIEAQAIATRLPIERAEIWPLDASVRRRCALAAWTRAGDTPILLICTDHELGFFALSPAHEPQLRALTTRLRERQDPIIILGGDFNTCGNFWLLRSSHRDAIAAGKTLSAANLARATAQPLLTYSAGPIRSYLDQIYMRGAEVMRADAAKDSKGSDHWPVVARISLGER